MRCSQWNTQMFFALRFRTWDLMFLSDACFWNCCVSVSPNQSKTLTQIVFKVWDSVSLLMSARHGTVIGWIQVQGVCRKKWRVQMRGWCWYGHSDSVTCRRHRDVYEYTISSSKEKGTGEMHPAWKNNFCLVRVVPENQRKLEGHVHVVR